LSPVLRTLVANQPEYAGWTPSRICLYYMQTVDVGSLRVSERDPQKAPMLGVWTLSATEGPGTTAQDVVEPAVTRLILFGALLVALMNVRPQGLLGTARVEIV
jgi:hypothetical protein